jgi:hypothetical protein
MMSPETIQAHRELAEYVLTHPAEMDSRPCTHQGLARAVLAMAAELTVTPERIEAAAQAGHAAEAGDVLPYWSWDSSLPSHQRLYRDIARAAALAFGLSVAPEPAGEDVPS